MGILPERGTTAALEEKVLDRVMAAPDGRPPVPERVIAAPLEGTAPDRITAVPVEETAPERVVAAVPEGTLRPVGLTGATVVPAPLREWNWVDLLAGLQGWFAVVLFPCPWPFQFPDPEA